MKVISRYRARNLAFLIPLAASGRKIQVVRKLLPATDPPPSPLGVLAIDLFHNKYFQVFVPTMDEMDRSCKLCSLQPKICSLLDQVNGSQRNWWRQRSMWMFRKCRETAHPLKRRGFWRAFEQGESVTLRDRRFILKNLNSEQELWSFIFDWCCGNGCALGCFSKDTLKKNKNPTPARNWGAPRKNISRRRGWSNKSRGSLKALEVWQNSRRRPRQCFWMWKVLFLLPPSAVQAEDDGCSENLFSRETAGETLEWRWSYPLVLSAAHSPLQREENEAETR